MAEKILVPQAGESISSGILAEWLVKDGDLVEEGQDIFELETDKATLTVPSPFSGKISIQAQVDDEVEVGSSVGEIDTSVSVVKNETSQQPAVVAETQDKNKETQAVSPAPKNESKTGATSPAVRRVAAEKGLNLSRVSGTGPKGRIIKADALSASTLEERKKMPPIRKAIAHNLVESQKNAAHLTTFNEVDMHEVMNLRNKYKDAFLERHGVKLGFMSFFLKASDYALSQYPEINAYIDGEEIVYRHYHNISVAVSTDKGLVTPVLRNVENKSFASIENEILEYAEKARNKKIMPDDLTGASFTVTNGGVFGSMLSTPIPGPKQSGILGMHSIVRRPVAIGDEILIRPIMYVALTYDHRIVDGRQAVGFLKTIKECIEDPGRLLLDI
jgi:2-oxoglutarate dehydrogenase E2 component (dihydrolipoamide succinyltransferase)